MNNQRGDPRWQGGYSQYGQNGQPQQHQPFASNGRYPMVVIPQASPQELSGYQTGQPGYHYERPYGSPHGYHPQASPQYGYGYHPQLQAPSPVQHNQHVNQASFHSNHHPPQPLQSHRGHQPPQQHIASPMTVPSQVRRTSIHTDPHVSTSSARQQQVSSSSAPKLASSPLVPRPSQQYPNSQPRRTSQPHSQDVRSGPRPITKPVPDSRASSSIAVDGPADDPPKPVDYQLLLLSLADQYITAARSMSNSLARSSTPDDVSRYHELMTYGLSCLASVIKNWKISDPRIEARLRLQYANLLFEETDNDDEAQAMLSKGITVCERSKLTNQKCAMQHLVARIQFKTSPKAALRSIDGVLDDLTAYNNVPWIYVFRMLRVSLAMQLSRTSEFPSTLQQLRHVVSMSESRRDIPIYVMAHVIEASLYLRSGLPEAVEQAERSIAAARSYQLDPSLQKMPQLRALIYFLDLCCDLCSHSLDQLMTKTTALQDFVDQISGDENAWLSSNFHIPLTLPGPENLHEETAGLLRIDSHGKTAISFRWLNKTELIMLGFLLSGIARLSKDCIDERAESYLSEAAKYAKHETDSRKGMKSLEAAAASAAREKELLLAAQINRIFALTIRSNWASSNRLLSELHANHSASARSKYKQILQYLAGVVQQGNGKTEEALNTYSSELLVVPQTTTKLNRSDLDIRILATMNRILILKSSPSTLFEASALLESIFPLCEKHSNLAIQSAANLLRATTDPDLGVLSLKGFLQPALQTAQKIQNHQLLSLVMNLMVVRFFTGIVGDQAEKSAMVGFQLSRKMRSPMWMAASGANVAQSLELHGKVEDADRRRYESTNIWGKAPDGVKDHFRVG